MSSLCTVENLSRRFTYTHMLYLFLAEKVGWSDHFDLKSRSLEPFRKICPISPHAIYLPEESHALCRISNCWIFKCLFCCYGNQHYRPTFPLESAIKLSDSAPVIWHTLQHVAAIDHIEHLIWGTDIGDVHSDHGSWIEEICREVARAETLLKFLFKGRFRGDVQQLFGTPVEQIRFLHKVQPSESVPFQRAAPYAPRISPRDYAVNSKPLRGILTDRTIPLVSPIERNIPDKTPHSPQGFLNRFYQPATDHMAITQSSDRDYGLRAASCEAAPSTAISCAYSARSIQRLNPE